MGCAGFYGSSAEKRKRNHHKDNAQMGRTDNISCEVVNQKVKMK